MKTAIKSTLKRLINGPRTEKELTCGDVAETSHANHTIRRLNEAEQQGFCVYVNDTWMLTQSGRDALAKKKEPLEYWNAVEGWVKIDEVREHFDSVGCATIYKTAGEGRVPLSLCKAQPAVSETHKQEPVALYENIPTFYVRDVNGAYVEDSPLKYYITLPPGTESHKRKPLTPEQISELDCLDHLKFARAIEAAHGIKGEA